MGTTQPIREEDQVKEFTNYYKNICPSARNQALIIFSLNTALRISDLLSLKWEDIYDFETEQIVRHLYITEHKTKKQSIIVLNTRIQEALEAYMQERRPVRQEYVFSKNTTHQEPLNRTQAYRIIRKAADETLHLPNISCHSMRKTFGYHAWKKGTPSALIMNIYNHSSLEITKRYLSISQDDKDELYNSMNL